MKSPVVDFHIHLVKKNPGGIEEQLYKKIYSDEEYEHIVNASSRPDNFVEYLKKNGVDYGVILAECCPLIGAHVPNETVEKFCANHKELIPFCTINPHINANLHYMLKDLVLNRGFMGVKLYPTYDHFYPNDPIMYPLYSAAEEMNTPILFHTGSSIFINSRIKYGNPIFFDDVAQDFPNLAIVMAHGGRGPWHNEAMTMVRLHKNVFIDISGLPVRKLVSYFPDMDRFSHKFILGTDWPQTTPSESMEKLHKIGLSEISINKIIGENAKKLMKLA